MTNKYCLNGILSNLNLQFIESRSLSILYHTTTLSKLFELINVLGLCALSNRSMMKRREVFGVNVLNGKTIKTNQNVQTLIYLHNSRMCNGEFIGMNKQTVESMFINLIRRLVDTRTLCKILRGCRRRLLNTATQLLPS